MASKTGCSCGACCDIAKESICRPNANNPTRYQDMSVVTTNPEIVTTLTEDGIEWVITAENTGFSAKAIGHPIFTQGATMEEVVANIKEATELHSLPNSDNMVYLSEADFELLEKS